MKETLKRMIKKSLYLSAAIYIIYNICSHLKVIFKNNTTCSGTTHSIYSTEESMQYIESVFFDYQQVSAQKKFTGKVAELGPGDSSGVALMFLAHGASQVDLADRFYSLRDLKQQNTIYQRLAQKYPQIQEILKQSTMSIENNGNKISGICNYYGPKAAGETFFDQHQGYDCIVSRSVLEHVDDPAKVLKKMFQALNRGGLLIHKVDLRDHGMFTPFDYSLRFLEIPTWLYKLMTYGSGYPNRFLFDQYKKVLQSLDAQCEFYVAGLYGVPELTEIYPLTDLPEALKEKSLEFVKAHQHKFAAEFAHVPLEDLSVSSFFFVCRKP